MGAKKVYQILHENEGIPWSGNDPTKAEIIGKVLTKKIGDLPSQTLDVVEKHGDYYIINQWYKPGVPQIVHEDMILYYVAREMYRADDQSIY